MKFNKNNIIAKRTGGCGISPIYYNKVIGKATLKDYKRNQTIAI